ncbi:hypothetical protein AMAG_18998 [Allomyces macrogynus ATCC 38327]|uniref:Uncharacterized protein n=1 Tax=Allomyces macrogynus (strain ATCC 38327) TaxID=578462 RepID=A0A0L0SLK3_ALLM3|nr:hypothetical protein AMAG_18998 [Allomyces macrogynus ATCC 38327]|eukprot:KNE63397.1 hypothetical protein AMAG_18998 [Allomyces macrogynus ATCC 38327]
MRWWTAHKLPYVQSPEAFDRGYLHGKRTDLDWWLAVLDYWRYESGVEPLYTEAVLDIAPRYGRMGLHNWWRRSGLLLKYTEETRRIGFTSGWSDVAA